MCSVATIYKLKTASHVKIYVPFPKNLCNMPKERTQLLKKETKKKDGVS